MWAQFIKARLRSGGDFEERQIARELEEQSRVAGIGPTRVLVLRNHNDPDEHFTLAFFEHEDGAREAERDRKQAELVRRYWAVCEAPPQYADLIPLFEWSL
jgi:hypothetical protein